MSWYISVSQAAGLLAVHTNTIMFKRLLLSCVFGACNGASSTGIADVSCPPDSTLTYQSHGETFVAEHCLSCHDSTGPTLTSQSDIQRNAPTILEAAVYTNAMPPPAHR